MAKKRRKEEEKEEEKYEFKPPNFDEKNFLEKDIKGTKTLFVSSIVAVFLGILAFALTGIWPLLGLIVIVAGALALRFIYPLFRIDFASIEKKTLLGNYVLLIFLALGVWIILLNPPFSDLEGPQIMEQRTFFDDGSGVKLYTGSSTPIGAGDLTNITVRVRDNGNIASMQIEVHASGASPGAYHSMNSTGAYGIYEFKGTYAMVGGGSQTQYVFTIKVLDGAGHEASSTGSFVIVP